jgi:hypothetical protein
MDSSFKMGVLKIGAYLHDRGSAPQACHSPERIDFADETIAPMPSSTVASACIRPSLFYESVRTRRERAPPATWGRGS